MLYRFSAKKDRTGWLFLLFPISCFSGWIYIVFSICLHGQAPRGSQYPEIAGWDIPILHNNKFISKYLPAGRNIADSSNGLHGEKRLASTPKAEKKD